MNPLNDIAPEPFQAPPAEGLCLASGTAGGSAAPWGDPKEEAIIRRHVLWSLSAGLIPVPVLDLAAVTAVQIDALKQLAKHHGVDCNEDSGKTFLAALTGGTLARLGASAMKGIPGVGTVLGGLTMSALSGASTFAVCQVASRQFRTGKSLISENADWAREAYREALEQGRKFVRQLTDKGVDKRVAETCQSILELQSLRDKGILSPEEYEAKKVATLEKLDA